MSLKSWRLSYLLLWLLWLWLHWSSTCFHGWECLKISFKLDACPLMWMASSSSPNICNPLWQLLFPLASSAIYIYLLITIRSFLQNLYQERSFSHSNIDLCNRAWRFSWSCPLCLVHLRPVAMLISFPSLSQFTFNIGAPLPFQRLGLWQDFERGIEIAEENELTI